MTNAEKVQLIVAVTNAVFQSKAANLDITTVQIQTNTGIFAGRWFGNGKGGGTLRGFDFTVQEDNGTIIPLRLLEQNPNKTDQFGNLKSNALLARQGHRIAWLIRRDTNKFLGKVMDGQWTKNVPRATTTVVFNEAVRGAGTVVPLVVQDQYGVDYSKYDQEWQRDLPEIEPNEISDYVMGV